MSEVFLSDLKVFGNYCETLSQVFDISSSPSPTKGNWHFNTILIFELWLVYEVSLKKGNNKVIFIMFISLQYYFKNK